MWTLFYEVLSYGHARVRGVFTKKTMIIYTENGDWRTPIIFCVKHKGTKHVECFQYFLYEDGK